MPQYKKYIRTNRKCEYKEEEQEREKLQINKPKVIRLGNIWADQEAFITTLMNIHH